MEGPAAVVSLASSDRADSLKYLPCSHVLFSNLKSWLRGTFNGVSKKHMPRYLDEFTYRLNQRWDELALFGSVLARAVVSPPLPYARLMAESGLWAEGTEILSEIGGGSAARGKAIMAEDLL